MKIMTEIESTKAKAVLNKASPDETVKVIRLYWRWGIQASMEVQASTFNPVTGDLITFRNNQFKVI